MNSKREKLDAALSAIPARIPSQEPLILQAEPEPLEIDLRQTGVIVIDMQNAFVSKGGMLDLLGIDVSETPKIIVPINKISSVARTKGCKVIYVVMVHPPDLSQSGGPNNGIWYKETTQVMAREHPEWQDKFTFKGTWGAQIVDGLNIEECDIVIEKQRYSAFYETNLDTVLKTYNIKYLIIGGVATNICVEGSIRDAYYHGYFPVLVSDAVAHGGPSFVRDATIFNIKICYGWVATTENILKAIELNKVSSRG